MFLFKIFFKLIFAVFERLSNRNREVFHAPAHPSKATRRRCRRGEGSSFPLHQLARVYANSGAGARSGQIRNAGTASSNPAATQVPTACFPFLYTEYQKEAYLSVMV